MPIFEFRCLACGDLFEKLFRGSAEKMEIICPKCGSDSFERVISRANYAMGPAKGSRRRPTVTTKSCSPGNTCATIDIPGPTR